VLEEAQDWHRKDLDALEKMIEKRVGIKKHAAGVSSLSEILGPILLSSAISSLMQAACLLRIYFLNYIRLRCFDVSQISAKGTGVG
jgi:hypothetical protein